MILGIGVELIGLQAFEAGSRAGEPAIDAVFTASERSYCLGLARPIPHLAARWAAKQALRKAVGESADSPCRWQDLDVARDERGKPRLEVRGAFAERLSALGVQRVHLSLTHTDDDAAAVVILEG
jgi:holo-[acyl-carrier protein] synthase